MSDQVTCPWPECGKRFGDLWDYGFDSDSSEDAEIECPHCDGPITLSRAVSVNYSVTKRGARS